MKLKEFLIEKLEKLAIYVLIFLIVIFAISLIRNILKVKKVSEKIEEKKQVVENLKEENIEYENKLEEIQSDKYIEEKLRNNLGLVKEGEIVIVLPEADVVKKLAPKEEVVKDELPDPIWKRWLKLFI